MGRVPVAHDDKVLIVCGTEYVLEDFGFYLEEDESPEGYMVDLYVDRKNDIYWNDWVVLNELLGKFELSDVDPNSSAVRKITQDVGDWNLGSLEFVAEMDKQTKEIHFLCYNLHVLDDFGSNDVWVKLTDYELASLLPMDEITEEVRLNM